MNVKERFNKLLSDIEIMAHLPEDLKPRDIGSKMSANSGIGYRDLNTIFTYITGISLLDYIRERQIMAAYEVIISMPVFDVEVAISVSGLDNQSSFGKKFKERFGLTPKEAFKKKDESLLEEQLVWDIISDGNNLLEDEQPLITPQTVKFGISKEQYQLYQQASDLQALYEFDDNQSEIAYRLSQTYSVPLKKTFDFVDDYCSYIDYDVLRKTVSFEQLLILIAAAEDVFYVYCNVVSEIGSAIDIVGGIKAVGFNPLDYTAEFLLCYCDHYDMGFEKFKKLADKFIEEHGDLTGFDYFLQMLSYGYSLEDALLADEDEDIQKMIDAPDTPDDDSFYDDPIQKWIDQETDYANMDRFDDNYDEDSAYYDEGNLYDFMN